MSDKLRKVVTDAQAILAEYIVPDSGISDHECINRLLALLDGPQSREALAAPSSTPAIEGLPDFLRKRVEQACADAENPKGMTTGMGMARVQAADIRRLLALLDRATSSATATPQGWRLVPSSPDARMYHVGEQLRQAGSDAQGIYLQMLDVAPDFASDGGRA
jgi:hypothetical protein